MVGVDVDPDQIEAAMRAAAQRPGVRFLVADATSLPFPDDEFDFVSFEQGDPSPFGRRLPTRRGLDQLAAELALYPVQTRTTPFHYRVALQAASHVGSAAAVDWDGEASAGARPRPGVLQSGLRSTHQRGDL